MFAESFFDELRKLAAEADSSEQLAEDVISSIASDDGTEAPATAKLPMLPRVPKSLAAKSDLVRAADRKKLLLGVKREQATLKLDIMRRILKKQRLALKPFKDLKKKQREVRLGLVRENRRQARRGYNQH